MANSQDIAEPRTFFVGRWRIASADLFDKDYLDLVAEAHLIVPPAGFGEMEFGAQTLGLDISVSPGMLVFEFRGIDEGDEVRGEGFMTLTAENEASIELDYEYGDFVVLNAFRTSKSGG